jgi:hypothetical protein
MRALHAPRLRAGYINGKILKVLNSFSNNKCYFQQPRDTAVLPPIAAGQTILIPDRLPASFELTH